MLSMRSFLINIREWQVRLVMRIKFLILSVCIMPFVYKTLPQILISMNYSLAITKIGLQKSVQIADNTKFIVGVFLYSGFCMRHFPSLPKCFVFRKYKIWSTHGSSCPSVQRVPSALHITEAVMFCSHPQHNSSSSSGGLGLYADWEQSALTLLSSVCTLVHSVLKALNG